MENLLNTETISLNTARELAIALTKARLQISETIAANLADGDTELENETKAALNVLRGIQRGLYARVAEEVDVNEEMMIVATETL